MSQPQKKIPATLRSAIKNIAKASSYEIGVYDAFMRGPAEVARPRLRHLRHVAERRMAMLETRKSTPHYFCGVIIGTVSRKKNNDKFIDGLLHRLENLCHMAANHASAELSARHIDVILRKCGQDIVFARK